MMRPDAKVQKVYLYPKPVDFRKSINGLAALVELDIKVEVFNPVLFVFLMSLIQSARLNGHDPNAYLKDVLTRLPTQRASEIAELLPHRWRLV